jgi:hypothetical protein
MTKYVAEKVATMERPVTAWFLCAVIFSLACVYAFFVNLSITNAVAAKETQSQISAIASKVSALESRYIAAKSSVTEADAAALGLSKSSIAAVYIAKVSGESLSFNR